MRAQAGNDGLLTEISTFCRAQAMAETTFGRAAINDGKLVSRLRDGGRITTHTLERLRTFMSRAGAEPLKPSGVPNVATSARSMNGAREAEGKDPLRNFRFFDNRQKYLLFVNTCSEKWVVANRVTMELANIHPHPPAVRVFDAGIGDGTVLSRVMRAMHHKFPTMPFYIAGKEISLEDVRLALQRMADRFFEHPATALVLTNLAYAEAPWLAVQSLSAASSLIWHELRLTGNSSHEFEEQIGDLEPFLSKNWKAGVSPRTGNPVYERPVVLVIYREDHRFLLDTVIPRPGGTRAEFDLVIASQPYRARAPLEFKANRVVAPLARALGPGGRLIGIHSHGEDPGAEIIQSIWPGDNPFTTNRHDLLKKVKSELGAAGRVLNFNAYSDERALFRYHMHALPSEVAGSIGTSTLFAAWNAATYVSQVEDDRLTQIVAVNDYLDATAEVLRRHGGLWFNDESFVISRHRD